MENKFVDMLFVGRQKVKNFFQKHYKTIIPILKLFGGLVVFYALEGLYGYSKIYSSVWFIAIMIVLFIIMPIKHDYLITSLFILINLTNVSLDVAGLYFAFMLIVYLLILRLLPQYNWIMAAVPVLFYFKIPCFIPLLIGMFCGMSSIIVMGLGIATYFYASYVKEIVILLNSATQKETVVAFRKIIQLMSGDSEFVLTMFILALVFVTIHVIYRQERDYAWYLSIMFGGFTYLILTLMQTLLLESNISIVAVIIQTVLAMLMAVVVQFFRCVIDYSRSEKIQFEDDEYYYYVKIVPKISIPEESKNVKKISTTSRRRKRSRD